MHRSLLVLKLLLVAGVPALATPWWEAYEGDVYPETLPGWERVHGSIPAQRWIDNGVLFIDSRADVSTYDYYRMTFSHAIDPGPGETFEVRWRLKVDEVTGYYDQSVGVTSDAAGPDEFYRVAFGFRADTVLSVLENGISAPITPGVFHDYELHSDDMRAYQLYVDGSLTLVGRFVEVFGPARVGWGDTLQGGTSLAEWDYVRFGVVVPEGSVLSGALLIGAFLRGARGGLARA